MTPARPVDAKRRRFLALAAGGGGAALIGIFAPRLRASGAAPAATRRSVVIENMGFAPADLQVHPGDAVTWTNRDLFPHTATADGGGFDSGQIAAGGLFTWIVARLGTYPYRCTLHPTMKGTLVVVRADTQAGHS